MDNKAISEELSQLARLLFDAASNKFYMAILLEVFAGILAAILGILNLSSDLGLFGAIFGTGILILAYGLRLRFEEQYDIAETMRRQALFTEALDWSVSRSQASEWRQKAGKQIRNLVKANPRPKDYYSTNEVVGAIRLAEMTLEGLFYTRHLYLKLASWIWSIGISTMIISVAAISIALSTAIPDSIDLLIAKVIYAVIPIVITINLFGWGLRLNRLNTSLKEIEESLDAVLAQPQTDLSQVIRLVSEYNCQVVSGFPIHNRLFSLWHDEIDDLWKQRQQITPKKS